MSGPIKIFLTMSYAPTKRRALSSKCSAQKLAALDSETKRMHERTDAYGPLNVIPVIRNVAMDETAYCRWLLDTMRGNPTAPLE